MSPELDPRFASLGVESSRKAKLKGHPAAIRAEQPRQSHPRIGLVLYAAINRGRAELEGVGDLIADFAEVFHVIEDGPGDAGRVTGET